MDTYSRGRVLPEWEPAPWWLRGPAADAQKQGFYSRALKPITWVQAPFRDFPDDGLLGHGREWFASQNIEYYAVLDGEELLLIRNVFHDWPEPPE